MLLGHFLEVIVYLFDSFHGRFHFDVFLHLFRFGRVRREFLQTFLDLQSIFVANCEPQSEAQTVGPSIVWPPYHR